MRGVLGFRPLPTTKSNPRVRAARACAKHGVHYVDITPEPHFIVDIVTKCVFLITVRLGAKNDVKFPAERLLFLSFFQV